MAALVGAVPPPRGVGRRGNMYYSIWGMPFEMDDRYVPIKPIGRGAGGVVCAAYDQEMGKPVAIKKICNLFGNTVAAVRTLREMTILRQLRHDNLIGLKDVMLPSPRSSFDDVYLVYDLMDADLLRVLQSGRPLSHHQIQYFIFQILSGLNHLHSANVLHRDLKPANILINNDCHLKICDFGLARTAAQSESEAMTEYVVTRWYRAPELLVCNDNYGPAVDVWSLGCIFAEILGRRPIFPCTHALNQLTQMIRLLGTQREADLGFIKSHRSREFIESLPHISGIPFSSLFPRADPLGLDLLEKMLVFNPDKRITVLEALQHPYMAGLFDPEVDRPPQFKVKIDVEEGANDVVIRDGIWNEMLYYHPECYSRNFR